MPGSAPPPPPHPPKCGIFPLFFFFFDGFPNCKLYTYRRYDNREAEIKRKKTKKEDQIAITIEEADKTTVQMREIQALLSALSQDTV